MPKDYSPFTPGRPVPAQQFVGRATEVERLRRAAAAAVATGRVQAAFLEGERGIGKSSLASLVQAIAGRDPRMLGIHSFLGGVSSLEDMAQRIFDRLLQESAGQCWHERIKALFGDHVKQVGLFGVSMTFAAPRRDLKQLVHHFAPALRNLLAALREQHRGILLVLDDINGLADSAAFANWFKSFVDEVATAREPLPVCILLVGLQEPRYSLAALQPSLTRVLDPIEIRPWPAPETREFFSSAFAKARCSVEPDALEILVSFAGGLPVLAHEIGDAVFQADTDDTIDTDDAMNGVFAAADIVGRKHLEPRVFQAIRSDRYRSILQTLAAPFEFQFRRSHLLPRLGADKARVFDSFLRRMKELGVIQADPDGGRGGYRFDNRIHHLYICMEMRAAMGRRGRVTAGGPGT